MERRPFSDDVARTTRAYFAALLPHERVTDAWHELVSDATYWHETEQAAVLRLAHQVLLQHERVSPDVAALTLRTLGVPSCDHARVLDVDPETIAAAEDVDLDELREPPTARPTPLIGAPPVAPVPDVVDVRDEDEDDEDTAAGGTDAVAASVGTALRIGFDEDEPLTLASGLVEEPEPRRSLRTWLLVAAVVVLVAVLVYIVGPF